MMRSLAIAYVVLALLIPSLCLAEDVVLQVTVTATSGRSVFLDRGENDGVRYGQIVRLFPPDGEPLEVTIQNTTTDAAQAVVLPGVEIPLVGTRGEIAVSRAKPASEGTAGSGSPDHPPWSRNISIFDESQPLLAPIQRERPEDRPPRWRGRVYTQLDYTWDRAFERDAEYYIGRTGLTLRATNPFKQGGQLQFSGRVSNRGQSIEGEEDYGSTTRWQLDRFSYALGGHEFSPYRLEFGRFYSYYVPDLGLIDGIEGAARFRNGWRLGAGLGWLPLPTAERRTGDDVGLHLFAAYEAEDPTQLNGVIAYQKTWHLGEADRDLILGRANWRPSDKWWLFGSFKADVYTGQDEIKKNPLELTEFYLQARYTPTKKLGFGLSASHFRWPEILREEFGNPTEELLLDGKVDRIEISSWYRFTPDFRVTGRLNHWENFNSEGDGGQLALDWTRITSLDLSLHTSVRFNSGETNKGYGVRAELRKSWKSIYSYFGYDAYFYELTDFEGDVTDYVRETVRGGFDWRIGDWNVNLNSHYDFGDGQDAVGLGVMLSYRF